MISQKQFPQQLYNLCKFTQKWTSGYRQLEVVIMANTYAFRAKIERFIKKGKDVCETLNYLKVVFEGIRFEDTRDEKYFIQQLWIRKIIRFLNEQINILCQKQNNL